jgi:dynamin 1-like protein
MVSFVKIPELDRFENLCYKISEVMIDVISSCLVPTDHMIRNLIEIEHGFINTLHPDFENDFA